MIEIRFLQRMKKKKASIFFFVLHCAAGTCLYLTCARSISEFFFIHRSKFSIVPFFFILFLYIHFGQHTTIDR